MRALIYHGPREIRCDEIDDPSPTDTDSVVVEVEATAICGSDLHNYHGDMGEACGYGIGHEAVGTIVEKGSGVRRLSVGDRVIVPGIVGCGGCAPCLAGAVNSCEIGVSAVFGNNMGLGGAQAEALAVPRADFALRTIPDDISTDQAVLLTDILPTGYYGAQRAEIEPGQDVAVIGAGPVGIMAIMSAQVLGAARVFALDSVAERLAVAEGIGAIPCNVADGGVDAVRSATAGIGLRALVEAVGSDEAIQTAIGLARPGGVVSVVGANFNLDFSFPMAIAMARSLTFRIGICPIPQTWPALVPLVASGSLAPEFVFTHRFGLSDGARAYELFDGRTDGVMKVMLDPRS